MIQDLPLSFRAWSPVFLTAFGVKEVEKSIKGLALALCVAGLAAQPAMADDVSTKGGIKVGGHQADGCPSIRCVEVLVHTHCNRA